MKKLLPIILLLTFASTSAHAGGYYNDGIKKLLTRYYSELRMEYREFPNESYNFLVASVCNETVHALTLRALVTDNTFREDVSSLSGAEVGTHDYWVLWTTLMYNSYYNRDPDAEGLEFWVERLDSGEDEFLVLNAFLTSVEATKKAKKFCGSAYKSPAYGL